MCNSTLLTSYLSIKMPPLLDAFASSRTWGGVCVCHDMELYAELAELPGNSQVASHLERPRPLPHGGASIRPELLFSLALPPQTMAGAAAGWVGGGVEGLGGREALSPLPHPLLAGPLPTLHECGQATLVCVCGFTLPSCEQIFCITFCTVFVPALGRFASVQGKSLDPSPHRCPPQLPTNNSWDPHPLGGL